MSDENLREWLEKVFRAGAALWIRAFRTVAIYVLPLAVVLGSIHWIAYQGMNWESDRVLSEEQPYLALFLVFLLGGIFGIALVGVVLSHRHTGAVQSGFYGWTLRRFVPWIGTWILIASITAVGSLAFILPGIYLGLRLFWADELVLLHEKGPVASLKASWKLTGDALGAMIVFQLLVGLAACVVMAATFVVMRSVFAAIEWLRWTDPHRVSVAEASIFVFLGLIAYGAVHATEIVLFYGMYSEQTRRAGAKKHKGRVESGVASE